MQKSLYLCSVCLHQWRVPQFALKYPCNPPPPQGETVAHCKGRFQRGGGGLARMVLSRRQTVSARWASLQIDLCVRQDFCCFVVTHGERHEGVLPLCVLCCVLLWTVGR